MPVPVLRQRRKTPKTRSGCRTCIERRTKCDEQRPACRRCLVSKRACPGYETPPPHHDGKRAKTGRRSGPPVAVSLAQPPSLPFVISAAESNTFDYFRLHLGSTPNRASWYPPWATLVVRAGQQVPAVFHGINGLSALHQWLSDVSDTKELQCGRLSLANHKLQFAIDQYCKSMKYIREYIEAMSSDKYSDSQAEICLMMCLLFISIEILQIGDSGMVHYKLALKIIRDRIRRQPPKRGQRRIETAPEPAGDATQEIELQTQTVSPLDTIVQAFVKFDIDLCLCGQTEPHFITTCPKTPTSFSSIDEAEVHLDVLANAIYRTRGKLLALSEQHVKTEFPTADENALECLTQAYSRVVPIEHNSELNAELSLTKTRLASYVSALVGIPMPEENHKLKAHLKTQMRFFSIWILASTWRDPDESLSDRFDQQFDHIASTAERFLILHLPPSPPDTPVSLDTALDRVQDVPCANSPFTL